MHLGAKNPAYNYSMGGSALVETTREKDLGVIVTPDLKSADQVTKAAAAANSMLGRVKRTFTYMDKEMFLPIYKTLVRPRMEHAIQAWSPHLLKDIRKLEKVQRRATKLVSGLSDMSYEQRLTELGLTSLQERRRRGDMIEIFKLIHGYDKLDAGEEFLKLESDNRRSRTRGHTLKLQKPRHRTLKRTKFFSARVVDQWNKLPEEVVTSKTVNAFKNRYDKHMASHEPRRGSLP